MPDQNRAITVDLINVDDAQVMLSDGTMLDITWWGDGDGDDCEPEEATVCVAGSDEQGWYTIVISDYVLETRTLH